MVTPLTQMERCLYHAKKNIYDTICKKCSLVEVFTVLCLCVPLIIIINNLTVITPLSREIKILLNTGSEDLQKEIGHCLQQERQEHLHKMCHKYGTHQQLEDITEEELKRRLILDPRHKVIYCAIPKAGNSAIKTVMVNQNLESHSTKRLFDMTSIHDKRFLVKHHVDWGMESYTKEDLIDMLRSPNYYKFTVGRHPFDRLLSAYVDKLVNDRHYTLKINPKIIREVRNTYPMDHKKHSIAVTFLEFVKYIIKTGVNITTDQHWARQYEMCFPCVINYDYIAKQETLDDDINRFIQKAYPDIGDNFTLPSINRYRSSHSVDTEKYSKTLKEFDKIPNSVVEQLRDIYRNDFRFYGYGWSYGNGNSSSIAHCRGDGDDTNGCC